MQYDKRASVTQREFFPEERVFLKPNPQNKHKPWICGALVGSPMPWACLVSTLLGLIRRAWAEPMQYYPVEQEQQTDQAIKERNQQVDQADPGVLAPEPT